MRSIGFCLTQVPGNENPSVLISFATKSVNAGQITSKLHVIELGAQPGFYVLPLLFFSFNSLFIVLKLAVLGLWLAVID